LVHCSEKNLATLVSAIFCRSKKPEQVCLRRLIRVARWYSFKPKIPIWVNLECLAVKDVAKYSAHLVYILPFRRYILWLFGIFCGHFGIFLPFWYVVKRQIWQPWKTSFATLNTLSAKSDSFGKQFSSKLQVRVAYAEIRSRIARWFILKPKIPLWVNFGDWKMLI
jgi:hypothetical protein